MPAKVLAEIADRNTETAKGWKSGRAFPNGASLINLARELPAVRAWIHRQMLAGGETEFDTPEFIAAVHRALREVRE